jgi:hypothetical protein
MKSEIWVTRDYGNSGKAVSLSKRSLGEFFFHLFTMGGKVKSSHCMNPQYHGSYMQLMIELPEGKRDEFESISGFTLETPPVMVPA